MFHQYHADIFWQIQRLPGYSSPSFFFFFGSHVQTPGSIVELVEHQRLDPLVVSGAAMQVRFPENWFKTSPCYGVMDQWYMFLIYVPFVMVIPIYGYDNHDICYDIICFLEIRSRRQGRRWWIEQLPESWHDADEPAEKGIERPIEPVFFLSFLALIPNCSRQKIWMLRNKSRNTSC